MRFRRHLPPLREWKLPRLPPLPPIKRERAVRWAFWLAIAEPYLLAAWLIGAATFRSRLLSGAVGVARLRRTCLPVPAKLRGVIEQLGRQLKINAKSLVFLGGQVTDAMAVA